jgi:hypothetical protein
MSARDEEGYWEGKNVLRKSYAEEVPHSVPSTWVLSNCSTESMSSLFFVDSRPQGESLRGVDMSYLCSLDN